MEFGAMDLTEYGMFESHVKFPNHLLTRPRTVEEYEIELYTEDQAGVCYINGREILLKKGTLLCAKPGVTRHSRLPFRCLYLHLKTQDAFLCSILDKLPERSLMSDMSTTVALFQRILALDTEIFPEERILLQSYVLELCFRLLQEVGEDRGDMHRAHRKTMQWVEQYIRQNPQENLELKALAARANLSPGYFHKLFTRHFGVTPGEYVLSSRIVAAKALLLRSDMSMEEIARGSGFSSQSYFNFCFKQQTGQTPLQYRKESLSRQMI